MKVKALLNIINKSLEKYPDFLEWDVYTEQTHLDVPENFRTIEEEIQYQKDISKLYNLPFNQEWIDHLKECKEKIDNLEKMGWKFATDSEGWVYRDTASNGDDDGFYALFNDKKIFTINTNF